MPTDKEVRRRDGCWTNLWVVTALLIAWAVLGKGPVLLIFIMVIVGSIIVWKATS